MRSQSMTEETMRVGRWRIVRSLGRDLYGSYYAGHHRDGQRGTLYVPSRELGGTCRESLRNLVELHRRVADHGLVGFRALEHDDDGPFLVADPVDDAMASLRSGRRPTSGQTREVGAALAATLVVAHDGGLIHGGLELDNTLWAPGQAPRILGAGVAVAGLADRLALARGDVVGLGRLLCVLVASGMRDASGALTTEDSRTIELVRMLADPSAALSMREAHALLVAGVAGEPVRHDGGIGLVSTVCGHTPQIAKARERAPSVADASPTLDYASDARCADMFGVEISDTEVTCSVDSRTGPTRADLAPSRDSSPDQLGGNLGRYRVLTRLGRGGMGEVFLAEDPALRRGVAIKRIRPGIAHDRTFRARLRREAQLAAHLGHRAIVQVFDLITEDDVDHMIMEYVPGPSLHALLAGGRMPVPEAVRIAAEIADGLAYAHQEGVIHRDLKLENILISLDGQPKIADFGLAHRAATSATGGTLSKSFTQDGYVVGTSRAMSPEQIQGDEIDARSDLFSFGVMLYELVTGRSPFAAGTDAQTFVRVLGERQLSACALTPEVPRSLSDLIDHLLEKDPEQRPDSARTVRERLRQIIDRSSRTQPEPRGPPIAEPRPTAEVTPRRHEELVVVAGERYPSAPRTLRARIQAPFVLAQIRALRSSIFKRSPEVQSALTIADKIEHAYDLHRTDLFIPALETFCAILEPFAMTVLTGTVRRIGYEIFPQYISILGIPAPDVKTAMNLRSGTDLVRFICDAYLKCVLGTDAGLLAYEVAGSTATITDTTFMPCHLQMGVFLGAGKLTGLFQEGALTEKRCRIRGDRACVYEFMV